MDRYLTNNQLLQKLHGLNYAYAETLVQYLRSYLDKDARAVEDVVTDMLMEMLTAQNNGISAQEHFGSDPQTVADAIIRQLPRASLKQWLVKIWPLFNVLGVAVIIFAFFLGTGPKTQGIIAGLIAGTLIFCFSGPVGQSLKFNRWHSQTKWRLNFAMLIMIITGWVVFEMFFGGLSLFALSRKPLICLAGILLFVFGNLIFSLQFKKLVTPWALYWLLQIPLPILFGVFTVNDWLGFIISFVDYLAALLLMNKQNNKFHFFKQAQ